MTREEEKEHYSYLYKNKYDGLEECYQPTLESAYEAGWEAADEHPISGEQIAAMKNEIKFLKRKLVECDKMYRELQNKNPWHKTDDDSPKEGVHYQMKDGEFLYGKPMLLHICEDDDDIGDDYKGYFDGKFWRYWDKPMSCDVVRGKVTHWMPIPQALKGGEK